MTYQFKLSLVSNSLPDRPQSTPSGEYDHWLVCEDFVGLGLAGYAHQEQGWKPRAIVPMADETETSK